MIFLQIALAIVVASFIEWGIHKYVLHGKKFGANKKSFWHYHWGEHHKNVRRQDYYEPDYLLPVYKYNAHFKEVLPLTGGALMLIPLYFIAPVFSIYGWFHLVFYYLTHRYSHLKPEWGKKWFRHHYDHHMLKNQHANWCVTFPIADWIMGTRVKGN